MGKEVNWMEKALRTGRVNGAKRDLLKRDLLKKLEQNGTVGEYYADLVGDYVELWRTKCDLNRDIRKRGVMAPYTNASGTVTTKKNESVELQLKVNAQMLRILDALGISPSDGIGAGDGDM